MRSEPCKQNRHAYCSGTVNRAHVGAAVQRLDECSCTCHRHPTSPSSSVDAQVRRYVRDRDGWMCRAQIAQICANTPDHVHHVRRAGQGGDDGPENLLTVCFPCHRWIHDHPADAHRLGLLARTGDE